MSCWREKTVVCVPDQKKAWPSVYWRNLFLSSLPESPSTFTFSLHSVSLPSWFILSPLTLFLPRCFVFFLFDQSQFPFWVSFLVCFHHLLGYLIQPQSLAIPPCFSMFLEQFQCSFILSPSLMLAWLFKTTHFPHQLPIEATLSHEPFLLLCGVPKWLF